MLQQFTCSWCQKEFSRKLGQKIAPSGKTYCSRGCYELGKRQGENRQCLYCGKAFYAQARKVQDNIGKYCSRECAKSAKREERICPHCKKPFLVMKNVVKQGGGKYCSNVCRIAYEQAEIVERQCYHCGKLFSIYGYQRKDQERRFCGYECYVLWRTGKNRAGELVCRVSHCPNMQYQEGLCEAHYTRQTFIERPHPAPEYAVVWKFRDRRPYGTGRAPNATTEWRQRYKRDVMAYYCAGKPRCMRCGFDDLRALCIDHVYHNGAEHRATLTGQNGRRAAMGSTIYIWLKKNHYPDGFQVLCANCNMIKEAEYREANPEKRSKKKRVVPISD